MSGAYETWIHVAGSACIVALVWALVWSVPALLLRRNDIADVAWGLAFPTLATLAGGIIVAPDLASYPRATLVLVLGWSWGMRLSWHIARRLASHTEDRRYAAWRSRWGQSWWWRSLLQVFVLQAFMALVVSQPMLIAAAVHEGDSQLGWLDLVGAAVVLAGLTLEATADRQLRRFLRRKRAGDVSGYLTTGVWAWSRHPNYGGDAILWWGFGLIGVAASLDAGGPWLIVPALTGPVLMTWLLRFVSGVSLSERGRAGDPLWDAYAATTPAMLPRPWRRG